MPDVFNNREFTMILSDTDRLVSAAVRFKKNVKQRADYVSPERTRGWHDGGASRIEDRDAKLRALWRLLHKN